MPPLRSTRVGTEALWSYRSAVHRCCGDAVHSMALSLCDCENSVLSSTLYEAMWNPLSPLPSRGLSVRILPRAVVWPFTGIRVFNVFCTVNQIRCSNQDRTLNLRSLMNVVEIIGVLMNIVENVRWFLGLRSLSNLLYQIEYKIKF